MGKKLIASMVLLGLFAALFTLATTYVFIPSFFPQYVGTPEAWAFTLIALIPAGLLIAGLLFIISRRW